MRQSWKKRRGTVLTSCGKRPGVPKAAILSFGCKPSGSSEPGFHQSFRCRNAGTEAPPRRSTLRVRGLADTQSRLRELGLSWASLDPPVDYSVIVPHDYSLVALFGHHQCNPQRFGRSGPSERVVVRVAEQRLVCPALHAHGARPRLPGISRRQAVVAKDRPKGENVVDLIDALRKSVGGAAAETKAAKKPVEKAKKAAAGQKEMLMPIAGKKPAKETAVKKPASGARRKSA
jgi:hypothetical protein